MSDTVGYKQRTVELASEWSESLVILKQSMIRLDMQRALLQRQIQDAESNWLTYEEVVREQNR